MPCAPPSSSIRDVAAELAAPPARRASETLREDVNRLIRLGLAHERASAPTRPAPAVQHADVRQRARSLTPVDDVAGGPEPRAEGDEHR